MNNENAYYWYELGYEHQCWGYPILDHAWGNKKYFWQKAKYPKKYQKYYRLGQIHAFEQGKAEKPWFYDENKMKVYE